MSPRDAGALAQAITRVLEDRELAVRLGQAGRARVTDHFSIDEMVRQTEKLYRTLLRRRTAGPGHDPEG